MNAGANSEKAAKAPVAGERTPGKPAKGITAKPWWPWVKRLAKIAFFGIVGYLLFTQARDVEWDEVLSTMRERPLRALLLAALMGAASHALYSCYDLLSRRYTGHRLPKFKVWLITFISYAFNLNMGSLIGGVAFRYRLYSRLGLEAGLITKVVLFSMLTNWLGYLMLGGFAFFWSPLQLPPDWKLDSSSLRWLGLAMMGVAAAYLLLCAFSKRRTLSWRDHEMTLPSLRLGLAQFAMSMVNWAIIGSVIYLLLEQKIEYLTVLSVLLVAAIAGVITHVPAGLGVLEAVFVALLSHRVPKSELLAVMLTYRVIYYLIPLAIAGVTYLITEMKFKRAGAAGQEAERRG